MKSWNEHWLQVYDLIYKDGGPQDRISEMFRKMSLKIWRSVSNDEVADQAFRLERNDPLDISTSIDLEIDKNKKKRVK